MEDIRKLDEQHADRKKSGSDKGTKAAAGAKGKNGQNQFQNFPQREIDYDALILEQLTEFK
jgi:hypothetical protein